MGSVISRISGWGLYVSIAENFINTGHFIQTDRSHEVGFVVPFGLPVIYTCLYGLFHNIYGIIFIQYVIFGLTLCFFRKATLLILKNGYLSFIAIVLYYCNDFLIVEVNPGKLLTEIWYMFLIVLWIYFFLKQGKRKIKI